MIVLRRIPSRPLKFRLPVAAIGIFDGVHRGHQAILAKAVARAKVLRGTSLAITFYPHPLVVLAPHKVPPLLLSLPQRLDAFASLGIQTAWVIPFTRPFSRWSPEIFVRRLLVGRLHVREVVVGHDFGFGRGRSGSVETLKEMGFRFGFKVHVAAPVKVAEERISSRRIREIIQRGSLAHAARLLGRPVTVVGRVIRGTGRGRKLGFPTANLKVEAGLLPPAGVYAVGAVIGGRRYRGMANLGFRPTFQKPVKGVGSRVNSPSLHPSPHTLHHPLVEVHLFGVTRSLYGRRIEVAFLKRLRSERRFPSPEPLARQLRRDARRAKQAASFFGLSL